MTRMTEHMHTHSYTQINTPTHTQWVSLSLRKRIVQRIWWQQGPCWLWLKGTLPSLQNNVAHTGKKLCALSDWRVALWHYLATGLLVTSAYVLCMVWMHSTWKHTPLKLKMFHQMKICPNLLFFTASLDSCYQKWAFATPLSKSRATCMCMQPKGDPWKVAPSTWLYK